MNCGTGNTGNYVPPLISSVTETLFVQSNNAGDLTIPKAARVFVDVDTSNGPFNIWNVDYTNFNENGQVIIFKKVTDDKNIIIDGENNHVNRKGETLSIMYKNGAFEIF